MCGCTIAITSASLVSSVNKLFEAIINKNVVDYNNLTDKQYKFHSSKPTADVLTVITNRIGETLDNHESDHLWYLEGFWQGVTQEFLHKLFSYGISTRVFLTITLSYRVGRS